MSSLSLMKLLTELRLGREISSTWRGGLLYHGDPLGNPRLCFHCSICLSPWGIECIDRRCRTFLWAGTHSRCRKVKGGLVSGLHPKGTGWPWGGGLTLPWCRSALAMGVASLLRPIKVMAHAALKAGLRGPCIFFRLLCRSAWTLGNGSNTMFWTDRWISGCSVGHTAPYLLATMPTRLRQLSVSSALTNRALGHGYPWTMDSPSDH